MGKSSGLNGLVKFKCCIIKHGKEHTKKFDLTNAWLHFFARDSSWIIAWASLIYSLSLL